MDNRIFCSRPCNVSQEFFVVPGLNHTDGAPYLEEVQPRPQRLALSLECADVVVDETIPEVGRRARWGNKFTAVVRAQVLYKGRFYAYLLQDDIGWPWVQVQTLDLVS